MALLRLRDAERFPWMRVEWHRFGLRLSFENRSSRVCRRRRACWRSRRNGRGARS
jgi:hypothetical protein